MARRTRYTCHNYYLLLRGSHLLGTAPPQPHHQVKHLHFQLYHSVFLPIDQLTHWSISFFPLLLTRIYSVFEPQKVSTHIFPLFFFPHPPSFLSHTSLQFVVVVFSPPRLFLVTKVPMLVLCYITPTPGIPTTSTTLLYPPSAPPHARPVLCSCCLVVYFSPLTRPSDM